MQVASVYDASLLSDDEQKVEIILHVRSIYPLTLLFSFVKKNGVVLKIIPLK